MQIEDGRKLGPEPLSTSNCPYLGTEFCHNHCDRGDFLPDSCTIDCQYCEDEDPCPCHSNSLPWKVELDNQSYLVINPHHSVYLILTRFYALYDYYPQITYLDQYGLMACIIDYPS